MGPRAGAFVHPALFYRDAEEFLAVTVPFVLGGIDAHEPVAVAVPGSNLQLLQAELGTAADEVRLFDMTEIGRNPGRILAEVLLTVGSGDPAERVRIIGEPVWPSRTELEYPACVVHEALINEAFRGRAATVLCPYDAVRLEAQVLADAAATHPVLIDQAGPRASTDYAPRRIMHDYNLPLPAPVTAAQFPVDAARLRRARRLVADHGRHAGLSEDRVEDLVIAAGELLANTVRHGGGAGTVRLWEEAGHLVCEVSDSGRIADPLAGRRPAAPHQLSGRGLLLVNHLADLVRTYTGPSGTITRIYLWL